ncbi:hypothetical protein D3C81_1457730 [compost metagenome]
MRDVVDHQWCVAFRVGGACQYVDAQWHAQCRDGLGSNGWRLVRRNVHRHGGRGGFQAFGVHRLIAEGGDQGLCGAGGRGVGDRRGAVEHNTAKAGTRLGQVADGQRYVTVRIAVVLQQVEGQRYTDTGTAGIGLGQRRLVFGFDWRIADHDHRFHIATAMGGLDGDSGRRLAEVVDGQALQDAGFGQATVALGNQVGDYHLVAGACFDHQPLVGPVVAGSVHFHYVCQLARQ